MKLSDLRTSSMGRNRKWLLVLAVAYLVVPSDVIPDFIPVVGWLDDVGVLGFAAAMLSRAVSARHSGLGGPSNGWGVGG